MDHALPIDADDPQRLDTYDDVRARIHSLLADEDDWISAMATVVCELHHSFRYYHWTGFYRVVAPRMLAIGPYQGTHGCLRIPFDNGICGAAARSGRTQRVDDVHQRDDHIACSASTRSEIVVPLHAPSGDLIAVLDVDSDDPAAFTTADQQALESLATWLGKRYHAEPNQEI